mmetsp:Transcript_58942/g.172531  ORF Transcript_58942/g.172531 Transcript_58942/m.172531 type:complete len:178 (-) Transcript_58942:280-813(-)
MPHFSIRARRCLEGYLCRVRRALPFRGHETKVERFEPIMGAVDAEDFADGEWNKRGSYSDVTSPAVALDLIMGAIDTEDFADEEWSEGGSYSESYSDVTLWDVSTAASQDEERHEVIRREECSMFPASHEIFSGATEHEIKAYLEDICPPEEVRQLTSEIMSARSHPVPFCTLWSGL